MRTALLGLLFLGACAQGTTTRPEPVAAAAEPCTVALDDAKLDGRLARFDDLTYCAPSHWTADGTSGWTVGDARLAWSRTAPRSGGTGPRATSSRGGHDASPIDRLSFLSPPVPQVVSGGIEAAAAHGSRGGGVVSWPSRSRADQVAREWSEELDGITARFTVTVDSRGEWRTTARWSAGPSGAYVNGTAGTVAEVEEQLAVLRTVRRVK